MTEPLVCCILPYHLDGFIEQAIECFESQTYQNKSLVSVNTAAMRKPVGAIRNQLCVMTPADCVIAHFDHDDWSCPTRLAEQVAFLQSSGAAVVGYRDMPFYDVTTQRVTFYRQPNPHFALGTSLMYWRKTWELHPFIETVGDEDSKFLQAVGYANVATESTLPGPKMIARIHPGNTSKKGGARYEKAAPELEREVRRIVSMALHTVRQTA